MADPAASIAVDPIYAPSPDMAALLQSLGLAPQTGAAATAAQPPPASAAVTAAPRLVRPQAPVVPQQTPVVPKTPDPRAPVAPQPAVTAHPQTAAAAANTNAALSPDMAALLQSLPPEYRAAFAARLANDAATTKAITDSQNQRSDLIKKMVDERPPVLSGIDHAFAAPPPPPDVQPLKAFQNFGVALALLGSLLTRRPMTAALKSGAAAMDAYNKGQYRDYAIQRQNWLDNVDLAMKQNQLEIDQYRAKQDAYRDDMDKMQLAMEQIAADNHDTIALQQLKNGQIDDFLQLIQHRDDMAQRYAMANMRYRLGGGPLTRGQAMHDDKIFQAQDWLTSQGVDWQDPKALEKLYQQIQTNGGFVDKKTQDILTAWKLAHEPTYEGMNSLPGLGRSEQTPPTSTGGHRIPWPASHESEGDGAIIFQKSTGKHWKRQGNEGVEVDASGNPVDGSADTTSSAPAAPAAPAKSSWWPF